MFRMILTFAALAMTPVTTAAQDIAPALDPTAIGQGIVASNIARQARGGRETASRRKPDASARARATCSRQHEFRTKFGSDDARVQELQRLCRRAGY